MFPKCPGYGPTNRFVETIVERFYRMLSALRSFEQAQITLMMSKAHVVFLHTTTASMTFVYTINGQIHTVHGIPWETLDSSDCFWMYIQPTCK